MKKRLLITSIVMMLVVAVALSTATYAWFTSNSSVTASTIKITAQTSNASALGIGWIGSSAYGIASNSITATGPSTSFAPMVPAELTVNSTTSSLSFTGATIKSVGGNFVFNTDAGARTPYTFTDGTDEEFYVKNLSTANDVANLRMTITWAPGDTYTRATAFKSGETYYTAGANNSYTAAEPQPTSGTFGDGTYYVKDTKDDDLVRIAVFARAAAKPESVQSSNYVLKGIFGKSANLDTEFGTVAANGDVEGLCTTPRKTVTEINFGALAAEQQIDMVVIAWLDGVALNDATAGRVSSFSLDFAATAAVGA
ncbi:MAG: hypothetical protein K5753_07315 [Clostridia bacterium]|nr:hypothetical protein [Clostridia bacterium]